MLTQTIFILHASAKEIYSVLLDSKLHTKLTGDKAVVDPREGGEFRTFGGYASGRTTRLVPNKLIEQTWRASDWSEGHYSKIKFEFKDVEGGCEIHFTQKNLPEGTEGEFESGWEDFYWSPLKKYFSK